jgi:hypothetical protein
MTERSVLLKVFILFTIQNAAISEESGQWKQFYNIYNIYASSNITSDQIKDDHYVAEKYK